MTGRRRLPVLQSPPSGAEPNGGGSDPVEDGEAGEERPPWHWVGFGTVAIFAAWLPLAYAAQAVVSRVMTKRFGAAASADEVRAQVEALAAGERVRLMATLALPNVLALGLAAFAGGVLVGRFAPRGSIREPMAAGATTGLVALTLSLSSGGVGAGLTALVTACVTLGLCVAFAAWGGRVGIGARARKASTAAK